MAIHSALTIISPKVGHTVAHGMQSNTGAFKAIRKNLPKSIYFKENVRTFFVQTSLNGLKYIADKQRSICERVYYLIAFSIVFNCGLYMVVYFSQKWQSTPVIISIGSKTVSIQDEPFPSVVFCNMNQALASRVRNIKPDTPEYAMLQTICFQDYNYTRFKDLKPRFKNDNFINFKLKNSQECSDMLLYCKYGANEEPCTNLFRKIFLDEGICCIFNRLNSFFLNKISDKFLQDYTSLKGFSTIPVNWNMETGYKNPLPKRYYPRKAAGSGVSLGLTVILNANIDEYFCSSTNGEGFKVLLTSPIDSANIKEIGLPIMLGHQTRVRINIDRIDADPLLKEVSPKYRQCYFLNEKKLLSYKYYTRHYCSAECDAFQILRQCGCIPYHLPKLFHNTSRCFLNKMVCVEEATHLLQSAENFKCKLNCLPSCNEIAYFPDLYAIPLAKRQFNLQSTFFANISIETMQRNLAMVEIFYKYNNFRPNTKMPYTGFTEFLSQSGGVMSLMVGFSVISIVEVFYFVLMKPFADMCLKRDPLLLDTADNKRQKDTVRKHFHNRKLFIPRRNINNRVMAWDKNPQIQHNEKY